MRMMKYALLLAIFLCCGSITSAQDEAERLIYYGRYGSAENKKAYTVAIRDAKAYKQLMKTLYLKSLEFDPQSVAPPKEKIDFSKYAVVTAFTELPAGYFISSKREEDGTLRFMVRSPEPLPAAARLIKFSRKPAACREYAFLVFLIPAKPGDHIKAGFEENEEQMRLENGFPPPRNCQNAALKTLFAATYAGPEEKAHFLEPRNASSYRKLRKKVNAKLRKAESYEEIPPLGAIDFKKWRVIAAFSPTNYSCEVLRFNRSRNKISFFLEKYFPPPGGANRDRIPEVGEVRQSRPDPCPPARIQAISIILIPAKPSDKIRVEFSK